MQTSNGIDLSLDGWIEHGNPGFETDGHYFIASSHNGNIGLERLTVRHGLLKSLEPAFPETRLVPARIVIEQGRHVSVSPNPESTKLINRAFGEDGRPCYVFRDHVASIGEQGEDLPPLDLVIGFRKERISAAAEKRPVKVFISYCHADEDLCERLRVHLAGLVRRKVLTGWYDRLITPGSEIDSVIETELKSSQIVMLLISPDFIASEYCMSVELSIALEMHSSGTATLIPTVLRPSDWHDEAFGKLLALPKNGKPVTKWGDQDEAFLDIVQGVKNVTAKLRKL